MILRNKSLVMLMAGIATFTVATPVWSQSLDTVIADTLANAPALEGAKARVESARAKMDQARAERGPSATIEGQLGVGRIDPQGFFGLSADNVMPRTARTTVELPLFTGGRISAAIRQAESGVEVADLQARMTELQLRVQVAQTYTQAVAAQQLIRQYEALGTSLDEAVRQARLKFKVGEGTSTEIVQAQARRAEAEAGLSQANGQLASSLGQLARLAGYAVTIDPVSPEIPAVPPSRDRAIVLATARNPMLLAAQKQVDAARAKVDGVRAERWPTIGAYAEASSVRDEFFPGYKADSASAGVRARWTIFSGGRLSARESGAAADLRAAEADSADTRLTVEQQAIVAYENVSAAKAVLAASEARVTATEAALRNTRLEVKVGAKPQLAQLDAEREAIEAQSALADVKGQLLVAVYRLRAITGMD